MDGAVFVATHSVYPSVFVDVHLVYLQQKSHFITACWVPSMEVSQGCRDTSFSVISCVSPLYPKQEV